VQAGAEDSAESDDGVQLAKVQPEGLRSLTQRSATCATSHGTICSFFLTGTISSAPPSTSSLRESGRCSRN
jgi:hypothetical protein